MKRNGGKKKNRILPSAGTGRRRGYATGTETGGGHDEERGAVFGRKEMLAESLKLPKDMLLGASILTMTGSHELWVENYKGIIEYTPKSIILQAKTGQISICGCGLVIDYYTNEDMKIIGDIRCVSYL